jgi:negative regulator of flagellin synthesis FlgM
VPQHPLQRTVPRLENAMKIGNPLDKPALAPATSARAGDAGAAKATSQTPTGSSTVELSNAASTLLQGSDGVQAANAEFDASKVERISNAIGRGQYTVNADVIADKLLSNAQELLTRPH